MVGTMDKEKFVQRVNIMLYETCGCNKEEAIEVLKECLKRAKAERKELKADKRAVFED